VIAIGGSHQFPHFLPVAFELHRRGTMALTIYTNTAASSDAARRLAERLEMECPPIIEMRLPTWLERLARRLLPQSPKVLRLTRWARQLRRCDALLSAERTSTVLRRLPGRTPVFLHIPHGAGDRAVGFERRLALFDHVIVAGEKDCARMVADGLVAPGACHIGGPVKLAAMARIPDRARLFSGKRPCVLYNPHFSAALGSFEAVASRLIDDVARDGRYDLIVAPHVRLADAWAAAKRMAWEARSVPGRILLDFGSERSIDMSYTLVADIYVGDVSSQIYEFLYHPRPCLFINTHGACWQGDPSYAMWRAGPVITPEADLMGAIDRAKATHATSRRKWPLRHWADRPRARPRERTPLPGLRTSLRSSSHYRPKRAEERISAWRPSRRSACSPARCR
jgi:hypothetical protein